MTNTDEILAIVRKIITLEEGSSGNFADVKRLSDEAIEMISKNDLWGGVDPYILKFLEDYDIRHSDSRYGDGQRARVKTYL